MVRQISNRTKELWRFIEKASRADIRLAEMEHPSLRKMMSHCSGRVPIYVHPCFYRSLKLKYPWISEEFPGTAELLLNSVPVPGVKPSASSPPTISGPWLTVSKVSGSDVSKPCHVECERTEWSKQVCAFAWWTLQPRCGCCLLGELSSLGVDIACLVNSPTSVWMSSAWWSLQPRCGCRLLGELSNLTSFALWTVGYWRTILPFSQHTAATVALGSLC